MSLDNEYDEIYCHEIFIELILFYAVGHTLLRQLDLKILLFEVKVHTNINFICTCHSHLKTKRTVAINDEIYKK